MFNEKGNFYFDKGTLTGRKVTRAYFEKWSDKEAREAFLGTTRRFVNQMIQKNDIGNMAQWMSHPFARIILQFRTFNTAAYSRQTLKALHFRDAMAARQIAMTSALAGAVYIVQKKLLAIGRSDKEEYEDKNLNWNAIVAGTIGRTGASSILPMIVDTALPFAGQDQMFSGVRSSGQANDVIFGNPSGNLYEDLPKATSAIMGGLSGKKWSQQEWKSFTRVLPFNNFLPLVMALNAGISNVPERSPRDRKGDDAGSIFGH